MSDAQSGKKLYLVWCYVTNGIIEPTGEQTEITPEELELLKIALAVALNHSKVKEHQIGVKALLKKLECLK